VQVVLATLVMMTGVQRTLALGWERPSRAKALAFSVIVRRVLRGVGNVGSQMQTKIVEATNGVNGANSARRVHGG